MSEAPQIEYAGSDEELEKYLLEFAARVGGWAGRDRKRGGWIVAGGSVLSTNPNTLDWRIRITKGDGILLPRAEALRLPWTRNKAGRISAFRLGQLHDFLETRLRGGSPDKFDVGRLREPFSPFGRGVAAITASFTWVTVSALAAMALCFLAMMIPSMLVLEDAVDAIGARAAAIRAAGSAEPGLPSSTELTPETAGGIMLGGAILFALPLAFFFGLVHVGALVLTEVWRPLARAGLLSAFFQVILLSWAFFPLLSVLAIPCAVLVPFGAHAGYSFIWGRRRERVREDAPPRKAVVIAGVMLASLILGAFVPAWASGGDFTDRLALFRDRYMLGTGPGRGLARFYYAFTLYAADPVKQFYSKDPNVPVRLQRIVTVQGSPPLSSTLAAEGIIVAEVGTAKGRTLLPPVHDAAWDGSMIRTAAHQVPLDRDADAAAVRDALDELATASFPAPALRDVVWLAWRAGYLAGPAFCLLVFVGVCCPWISIIYRTMAFKTATIAVGVCCLTTGAMMAWDVSRKREAFAMVSRMDAHPQPSIIEEGFRHDSLIARHHAAYLAFRHPHPDLADALLRAADHEDLRVRLWAVAALGKTKDPRALEVLLKRLEDESFFVRYRAAEGLGYLGRREAIDPLTKLANTGWWYEGVYAVRAIRRITAP